ncbi:FeoA family protein [Anaerosporobacter sp.]|uniref:FeoA family protein n=1 Tax=Anaerosporobacter sp. TaxID=1872529 RepID=UPI00286F4E34|nr:FeoA domain-containing protein [Anaerosporobacter sp.]
MTLLEGRINQIYCIDKLLIDGNTGRRLQSLGLIQGTDIKVLNKKRNGAIIFKARGTRLAVGKDIAVKIVLTEEAE